MTFPAPSHVARDSRAPSHINVNPTLLPRLLYSRQESAYQWSISVRAVDYMISAGTVHVRRIGGRILIPHSELIRIAKFDQIELITSSSTSSPSSLRSTPAEQEAA